MKLTDIDLSSPEEPKRRQQKMLRQLERQFGTTRKRMSPEEKAAIAARNDEWDAKRARAEAAIGPIAKKYSGDQFEEFKAEVLATVPEARIPNLIDLWWAFKFYNPERRAQWDANWADFFNYKGNKD